MKNQRYSKKRITDQNLMLSEVSQYFKTEYQRMLKDMARAEIRMLWHILHGRRR